MHKYSSQHLSKLLEMQCKQVRRQQRDWLQPQPSRNQQMRRTSPRSTRKPRREEGTPQLITRKEPLSFSRRARKRRSGRSTLEALLKQQQQPGGARANKGLFVPDGPQPLPEADTYSDSLNDTTGTGALEPRQLFSRSSLDHDFCCTW